LEVFFRKVGTCRHMLAWEPRGDWPKDLVRNLCARPDLILLGMQHAQQSDSPFSDRHNVVKVVCLWRNGTCHRVEVVGRIAFLETKLKPGIGLEVLDPALLSMEPV
jgi:hypothetical protein